MQLKVELGEEFNCTSDFWAKISTIKLTREVNNVTAVDCPRMFRKDEGVCWVKERVEANASDAIREVVLLPLQDDLQDTNCICPE